MGTQGLQFGGSCRLAAAGEYLPAGIQKGLAQRKADTAIGAGNDNGFHASSEVPACKGSVEGVSCTPLPVSEAGAEHPALLLKRKDFQGAAGAFEVHRAGSAFQFEEVAVHRAAQGAIDDLALVHRVAGVRADVVDEVVAALVAQQQ